MLSCEGVFSLLSFFRRFIGDSSLREWVGCVKSSSEATLDLGSLLPYSVEPTKPIKLPIILSVQLIDILWVSHILSISSVDD